jgi:Domain of unknown function (DUF4062)
MATIYLSSTFSDLEEHRRAVSESLREQGHVVRAMEDDTADPLPPLDKCRKDVAACELYVGIFAWRYGDVPPDGNPEKKSITEHEYREAAELGMPCLVFVLRPDAPWPPTKMDAHTGEGDRGRQIRMLRDELLGTHTAGLFSTPEELVGEVVAAVRSNLDKPPRPLPPPELSRVLERLGGLRGLNVKGKKYRDEKWHLGPELDRLSDAIAIAGNDRKWRAAYEAVRNDVLLEKAPKRLDKDIRRLEALRWPGSS